MKDEINEQEFESKWEADIAYGDPLPLFPHPHYTPGARKHAYFSLFCWEVEMTAKMREPLASSHSEWLVGFSKLS